MKGRGWKTGIEV